MPGSRSSTTYGVSHEPQASSGLSRTHSKLAVGSVDENVNVAVELAVGFSGRSTIVVSGTTVASPAATANGERLSTMAQTTEADSSTLTVASIQSSPS
jgi:hypothetical protein